MNVLKIIFFIFIPIVLIACSSVSKRIKEKERQFVNLTPQEQMLIQQGEIDLGFNEDMVYMAKGRPSEVSSIQKNGKNIKLWKYKLLYPNPKNNNERQEIGSGSSLNSPFGHPQPGKLPQSHTYHQSVDSYFIIEFQERKVVGFRDI